MYKIEQENSGHGHKRTAYWRTDKIRGGLVTKQPPGRLWKTLGTTTI
jgi:hypothetical protein